MPISKKSHAILEAIAQGHSYEQILAKKPAWTYHDIFQAAAEALETGMSSPPSKAYDVETIRRRYPGAYRKWDDEQDMELRQFFAEGLKAEEIAELMQRQSGGIRSRLAKLGLIGPGSTESTG